MPLSPEWKNLPRRKCDDCGKSYKPVRPKRILNGKEELGFCSANCRKSYHKHGGAYRKLKAEMQKMVVKEFADIRKGVREMVCDELAKREPALIAGVILYLDSRELPEGANQTSDGRTNPVSFSNPAAHRASR